MRWLLHGNLSYSVRDALQRHAQQTVNAEELALLPENYDEVLRIAQTKQLEILTNDQAMALRIFEHPQKFNHVIVFLQLSGGEVEQDDAIDRLFERYKRLSPGRLYTVTENRVKVRQLPSSDSPQRRGDRGEDQE